MNPGGQQPLPTTLAAAASTVGSPLSARRFLPPLSMAPPPSSSNTTASSYVSTLESTGGAKMLVDPLTGQHYFLPTVAPPPTHMMAATTAYYPVYPAHHQPQHMIAAHPAPTMFIHHGHPGAPTAYASYVTPQSPTHVSGGQPYFHYPMPHHYPLHQPQQHSHGGGDERVGGEGDDPYCRVEIPPSSAASVCCDESLSVSQFT